MITVIIVFVKAKRNYLNHLSLLQYFELCFYNVKLKQRLMMPFECNWCQRFMLGREHSVMGINNSLAEQQVVFFNCSQKDNYLGRL